MRDELLKKILEDYDVNRYGLITTPGKFENRHIAVPYFYELSRYGYADDMVYLYNNQYFIFILTKKHKKLFPDLKDAYAVVVYETEPGFVDAEYFRDKRELREFLEEDFDY